MTVTEEKKEKRLPVSDYVSALVASVVAKSRSLATVKHNTMKGHYNEVLFRDLLYPLLPSFLKVASGKVVYRRSLPEGGYDERESDEQDVIVYDSRLIGPLIEMHGVGYIPIDTVIATAEVKYRKALDASVVSSALAGQQAVADFFTEAGCVRHLHSVLLFSGVDEEYHLLDSFEKHSQVQFLCIPGTGCALNLAKGISRHRDEEDGYYEATKAFIAVFADNCRTFAEVRYRHLTRKHEDWISHYIRTQGRPSVLRSEA